MITNIDGFPVAPQSGGWTGEARHFNEFDISSRSVATQQFQIVNVANVDAQFDAKLLAPRSRNSTRQIRRQTFVSPALRLMVADDIKAAFRQLIDQSEARAEAAGRERERVAKARADFESEFKLVMAQVVIPTLNEIGSLLQQSGWICTTTPLPSAAGVGFEVTRPAMKTVVGRTLPHIAFLSVPEHLKVGIRSFSGLSGSGRPEYPLKEISSDFVAQQMLLFFRRLTDDWTAVGR